MTNPCKDCQNRQMGCHSICKDYADWKEVHEAHLQAARESKAAEVDFKIFAMNGAEWSKRRYKRRV